MTVEVLCFLIMCVAWTFGFVAMMLKLDNLKDEIRNLTKELKNKEK